MAIKSVSLVSRKIDENYSITRDQIQKLASVKSLGKKVRKSQNPNQPEGYKLLEKDLITWDFATKSSERFKRDCNGIDKFDISRGKLRISSVYKIVHVLNDI